MHAPNSVGGQVSVLDILWNKARLTTDKEREVTTQLASDALWHGTEAMTAIVSGLALAELGRHVEEEDISFHGAAPFALAFVVNQACLSVLYNRRGLRLSRPAVLAPLFALFPDYRWLASPALNFSTAAVASLVKSCATLLGSRNHFVGPDFCNSWNECFRVASIFLKYSEVASHNISPSNRCDQALVLACALRFDFLPVFVKLSDDELGFQTRLASMSEGEFKRLLCRIRSEPENNRWLRALADKIIPKQVTMTAPTFSQECLSTAKQCAKRIVGWGAPFFILNFVTTATVRATSGS